MPSISSPVIGDNGARAVKFVTDFIHARLAQHRQAWPSSSGPVPPLFVGVQGPQGSGKSHLVSHLPASLGPLRTASLSLDELYLPHTALVQLGSSNPSNKLIQGRGQPGTHDLPLGISVLSSLAQINSTSSSSDDDPTSPRVVELPTYDKSLHNGQGDRSVEVVRVEGPIDIVLFEGWCNGFRPLPSSTLTEMYERAQADPKSYAKRHLDYDEPFFVQHQLENLLWVNERLGEYVEKLWERLDCFVQVEPKEMGYVWHWRLEQEHNMKAKNGGKGMTDDEVKQFIARYMPSYELFQGGIQDKSARWSGKGLKLVAGRQREVVAVEEF